MSDFAKQLDAFVNKVERRLDHVVKASTDDVFTAMQTPRDQGGRMPVDEGDLQDSLDMSVNGMAAGKGKNAHKGAAALAKAGDTITGTYDSPYAKLANDGKGGRPGNHFVEGAADRWGGIVKKNVAEAKAKHK